MLRPNRSNALIDASDVTRLLAEEHRHVQLRFIRNPELVYIFTDSTQILVYRCVVEIPEAHDEREIFLDAGTGKILSSTSLILRCYHDESTPQATQSAFSRIEVNHAQSTGAKKSLPLKLDFAQGTGKVFKPDPLTSSGHQYGDIGYTDNNDADSQQLTSQLFSVTLDSISYADSTGLYSLIGPYCSITDFSPPNYVGDAQAYERDSSNFSTTRSDSTFEAVMAYYHITKNQLRIHDLGYNDMWNRPIEVDPHGLDSANNAIYFAGSNRIAFGEPIGAVDNAEDASTIIHEYGHAIHDWNDGIDFTAWHARSLSEGFADYWGASHGLSFTVQIDSVHRWSGRANQGGFTRSVISDTLTFLSYKVDTTRGEWGYGQLYINGTIWASTLMKLNRLLGKNIVDQIVLESMRLDPDYIVDNAEGLLFAVNTLHAGNPDSAYIYNTICGTLVARMFPMASCTNFSTIAVRNLFERGATPFESEKWIFQNQCNAPFPTGAMMAVKSSDTVTIRSQYPRYFGVDVQNPSNRHSYHNWNLPVTGSAKYYFTKTLYPTIQNYAYESFLYKASPAIITTGLDLNFDGATLFFRDPWYTYGACTYTQPQVFREHLITSDTSSEGNLGRYAYGGIFLNQGGPDPLYPISPYHSIRASKFIDTLLHHQAPPQQLSAGDLTFAGWIVSPPNSATLTNDLLYQNNEYDTRAVIFHQENAEVKANYKAHLLSNKQFSTSQSISATSPNSQRKIDHIFSQAGMPYGSSGMYQAVYESSGEIFLMHSTDMSSHWSAEIQVSEGNQTAKHPCIASDTNAAFIAYRDGEGITVKKYRDGAWSFLPLRNGNFASEDAAPVIEQDGMDKSSMVVWEKSGGGLAYSIYMNGSEKSFGNVPYAGASAQRPSIAHFPHSTLYYLTWRENQNIYYQEITVDPYTQNILFGNKEQVNLGGLDDAADNSAPSITVTNYFYGDTLRHAVVSWETIPESGYRHCALRMKHFYGWGDYQIFWPGAQEEYWAPSVMSLDVQPCYPDVDAVRVACNWDAGYNPIKVFRLQCGSWNEQAQQCGQETLHPSTVAFPALSNAMAIYCDRQIPTHYPSNYTSIRTCNNALNKSMSIELHRSRELILRKDTTNFRALLGDISLQTTGNFTNLDWQNGFDTLVVGVTTAVENTLRTKPFIATQGMRLKCTLKDAKKGYQQFPNSMYLKAQIVRAGTNQALATMNQLHPRSIGQGRRSNAINFNLNPFVGEEVYVRLSLVGMDSTVTLSVADYYTRPGQPIPKFSGEIEQNSEMKIPEIFSLDQNDPNPFSSTTEIRYTIPYADRVKISVFDLLGREIEVLVDGYREAGKYTATFSNVVIPSGVYFYRLISDRTVITKKMCLVR